jgi:hypothetical protein
MEVYQTQTLGVVLSNDMLRQRRANTTYHSIDKLTLTTQMVSKQFSGEPEAE